MIETKEKIIDGATYTVTQLPARRAIRLKAKLIKLFGPALAQFSLSIGQIEGNSEGFVKCIQLLTQNMDENAFESLCVEMLQGVRKNGVELTPATIDLEFAGDMSGLYQALWFVVEVNFSNFFSLMGIGSQFADLPNQAKEDTKKIFRKSYVTSSPSGG